MAGISSKCTLGLMKGEVPSDDDLHLVLSLTLARKQKKHEKLRVKLTAEQRSNGFDVILEAIVLTQKGQSNPLKWFTCLTLLIV